jgi:muramoyltetrapeptide carboxypeptidase
MTEFVQPLQRGDLIYITSPAKAIDQEAVLFAKAFFENAGFSVEISAHCLGQHHYFSGTDEERAADFQYGLDSPEIKAIVCARGGYGCVRIVDRLQWASMLRHPKWIVGFSDVTVFHHRMHQFNLPSIHGTMPLNFQENTSLALDTLLAALTGNPYTIRCATQAHNKIGSATGKLIGGNLSIIYSLLGTNDGLDFSDSILFIEDLSEQLYSIDRMFFSLEKAGAFDKIKGLIVGGMTHLKDTEVPFGKKIEELVLSHFQFRKIPIAFGFSAGHIENNQALILGKTYTLLVEEKETRLH